VTVLHYCTIQDHELSLFCCMCCLCLQKFCRHDDTGSMSLYNQLTIPHCTITQNTILWLTPTTKARYLPQLHLYGWVQLHEPCIKIELLCLRLVDAHIGSLRRQLADVLQVFAQLVTQLSELRLAVVFQAEGERLQHTQQFHGTPAEGKRCHCGTL
jgi:hypothetical protein